MRQQQTKELLNPMRPGAERIPNQALSLLIEPAPNSNRKIWFRQSPIQRSSMDKIRSSLLYDEGTQCEAEADEGMMQQGDNQKLAGSSTD